MRKALGIDVGGTKIYSAVIDNKGNFVTEVEKHSTPRDLDKIREIFLSVIAKYDSEIDAIAFSTAGACNNAHTGILGSTGNMVEGYSKFDFQSLSSTKPVLMTSSTTSSGGFHSVLFYRFNHKQNSFR